ncbi:MAG: hypothetical protein LUF33_08740 [Clostridiales bacterium]|nr:hypothetical protein [Clostridiales bacterium]
MMIDLCWFSEMQCNPDTGSINNYILDKVEYDKKSVVDYLSDPKKRIAGCPKPSIDCITGKKLAESFFAYSDGEYCWGDFLPYHIQNYNIDLPKEFLNKVAHSVAT